MDSRQPEVTSLPSEESETLKLQDLLHENTPRLLEYLERHFPNELRRFVEPQDVLQDTFFEACRRFPDFVPVDDDAPFRWLVTIARHRVLALWRGQQALIRGGHKEKDNDLLRVVVLLEELAVYERTPSQSAMAHEMAASVQRSLKHLPSQYEQALRMRYIDGLSVEQTALSMNRSIGAVFKLCNRGLKVLKGKLQSDSLSV
jgi:RNA polymerase sigma-70 factor (ECF subfamily)